MPRFEAASISMTSSEVPAAISLHESHTPQGSGVGPFTQFSALAKILAAVVFPTPRAPHKLAACPFLPHRPRHADAFSLTHAVRDTGRLTLSAPRPHYLIGP